MKLSAGWSLSPLKHKDIEALFNKESNGIPYSAKFSRGLIFVDFVG